MTSLTILDIKDFMSQLFLKAIFDNFLVSSVEVKTCNSFKISGQRRSDWYTKEEWEILEEKKYMRWGELKPVIFQLIKGQKTPSYLKMVFLLSEENVKKILEKEHTKYEKEEIQGLYLNIHFDKGKLSLITGTSLSTFTLEKKLDRIWDDNMILFLKGNGIAYEC